MSNKIKYDPILGNLRQEDAATVQNTEGLKEALNKKEEAFIVLEYKVKDGQKAEENKQTIEPTFNFYQSDNTLDSLKKEGVYPANTYFYKSPIKTTTKTYIKGNLTYKTISLLKIYTDSDNKIWQEIEDKIANVTYKRYGENINNEFTWLDWYQEPLISNQLVNSISQDLNTTQTQLSDLTSKKRTYIIGVDVYKGEVQNDSDLTNKVAMYVKGFDIDTCITNYWYLDDLKNLPGASGNNVKSVETYPCIYDIEMVYHAAYMGNDMNMHNTTGELTIAKGVFLNYVSFGKFEQYLILFCREDNDGLCSLNTDDKITNRIYKRIIPLSAIQPNNLPAFQRVIDPIGLESLKTRITSLENHSITTPQLDVVENGNEHELRVSYDNGVTWETLTTIYDGNDGNDGLNGSDGYNGSDGINGVDGITPQLDVIENGNEHELRVSYDNGVTWETLTTIYDGSDGNTSESTNDINASSINYNINIIGIYDLADPTKIIVPANHADYNNAILGSNLINILTNNYNNFHLLKARDMLINLDLAVYFGTENGWQIPIQCNATMKLMSYGVMGQTLEDSVMKVAMTVTMPQFAGTTIATIWRAEMTMNMAMNQKWLNNTLTQEERDSLIAQLISQETVNNYNNDEPFQAMVLHAVNA